MPSSLSHACHAFHWANNLTFPSLDQLWMLVGAGRFVNSIQVPGVSQPASDAQQPWGTILAVLAGALAYSLATKLGQKERAEPQETGLKARDEGSGGEKSQVRVLEGSALRRISSVLTLASTNSAGYSMLRKLH